MAGRYRAHFSDAVSEEELLEGLRAALTEGGTGQNSTRI